MGERTPDTPRRIQRKRTQGWRMPAGTIYVGRPTRWGNPYRGVDAAERLERELRGCVTDPYGAAYPIEIRAIAERLDELAGDDLACWCPPGQPCHADVLLELANGAAR